VLAASSVAVAGAIVGSVSGPALAAAAAYPLRQKFSDLRGGQVSIRTASGAVVRATVAEVRDIAGRPAGDQQCYAVLLRPRTALPDGSYRVVAPGLGAPSLFFANVDRRAGAGLEAIIQPISPGGLHG
jgi:hypothetical protein